MERRKARETVLGLLFEREFKKEDNASDILRLAEDERDIKSDKYIKDVYFGVVDNIFEIDEIISKRSIGWKTHRMTKLSLSILRLAVYELKYCSEIPYSVSINEAVELAKTFGDDKTPSFINGILNNVAEDLNLKVKINE